jgi:cell wall-associated NlpC family hydrolase
MHSTIRKTLAGLILALSITIPTTMAAPTASASDRTDRITSVARDQVGDNYQYGSAGPSRFDCSGLVKYTFERATDKTIPHSSAAIRQQGRKVSKPRAGDIVYTKGHVSIFLGDGKVVEAAGPGIRVRVVKRWQKNPTYLRF